MRSTQNFLPSLLTVAVLAGCGQSIDEQTRFEIVADNQRRGDHTAAMLELTNILEANPRNQRARLMLGEVWLAAGRYAAAERQLTVALAGGAPPSAYLPLGQALLALGAFDRVLAELPTRVDDPRLDAQLAVLRARALMHLGALDDADTLLADVAARNSGVVDVRVGQALAALAHGDTTAAETHAREAVNLEPFSVSARRVLGVVLSQQQRHEEAELEYAHAIEVSGSGPQTEEILLARVGMAEAQWRQGRTSKALQNLKDMNEAYPWHPLPRFLRALISYQSGDYNLAEEYLLEVLRGVPDHRDSQILMAAVNYAQGRLKVASRRLDELLTREPDSDELRHLRAGAMLAMGDPAGAAATLADLPPAMSADPALTLLKARALLYAGEAAGALPYFDIAMRNDPLDNDLKLRATAALIDAGRLDEAAKLVRQIPAGPQYARATDLVALSLAAAGPDKAQARRLAKELRQKDPSNLHAMLVLANLARERGDLTRAVDWLQLARLKNPDSYEPLVLLAYTQLAAGDPASAKDTAREGSRAFPYDVMLLNALGSAQYALGEHATALDTFRRAVDLVPQDAQAWFNIARVQLEVNDFWTGKETLARAVELSPNDLSPARTLVLEQLQRGKHEQALALARDLQTRRSDDPTGYHLEGDLLMARSSFTEAAQAYREAADRDDDRMLAIKGFSASQAAGRADAANWLVAWLARHPDDRRVKKILERTDTL